MGNNYLTFLLNTFLLNIYLGIFVFQLGTFTKFKNFTYQLIYFISYCCYEPNMLLKIYFVLSDHIE